MSWNINFVAYQSGNSNYKLAQGYSEYHKNFFCDHHTHTNCFSVDQYQDDINTENPLGTGGKLAVIFANLMRNLWSGKERSLSPYKLKVHVRICMYACKLQQYTCSSN